MVASRRLWGEDKQRSAQHQARRRGELGVEALLEDGGRSGEEGGLRSGVEAGGPVDEEDDAGGEKAEHEYGPSQSPPAGPGGGDPERRGDQRHRDQEV